MDPGVGVLKFLVQVLRYFIKFCIATRIILPVGWAFLAWCVFDLHGWWVDALLIIFILYSVSYWVREIVRKIKKDPAWGWTNLAKSAAAKQQSKPSTKVASSSPEGVVFGKAVQGGKWICRNEQASEMVLVFGAPGTGKSQAIALPSLSVWKGAQFAIDIKGELWDTVGHTRPNAKKLFIGDDPTACGFNPFQLLQAHPELTDDVCREIALTLVPKTPDIKDPFWEDSAQNLLTAALISLASKGVDFSEAMKTIATSGGTTLVGMIDEIGNDSAKVYNGAFINLEGTTLDNIFTTLHSKIAIFGADKNVVKFCSNKTTVTTDDLKNGASIYFVVPENKIEQYKTVISMVVKQFLKAAETWENDRAVQTLFLIDEMPRLGKLPAITNALATLRSKGVCVVCIGQSLAQFEVLYGKPETAAIVDLCAMKCVLSATGETAEMLSKMVGDHIEQMKNTGKNTNAINPLQGGNNAGISEQYEQIIRPSEWANLGEQLVLIEPNSGYVRVKKMPFYANQNVYEKNKPVLAPPTAAPVITGVSTTATIPSTTTAQGQKACAVCGTSNSSSSKFCAQCGNTLDSTN